MASRELQLAIELCRFSRRKRRPTVVELGGLAELRARYDDIAESHPLPEDVSYQVVDAGGVSAEWVSGPWCRDDCTILYLHGGCYATGSVETHRDLITRLSVAAARRVLGWANLYLGDHDPRTPRASPLYADLRGIPPTLIQVGSAEVLLDDATRLAERASAAGVETTLEVWPEMIHVWHSFAAILPEARDAIARIGTFIRNHFDE